MSGQPGIFSREVSPNEALYIQLQKLYTEMTIQFVLEGSGEIDGQAFTEAVSRASAACPGIRCVLKNNRWQDSGNAPAIHFTDDAELSSGALSGCALLERKLDVRSASAEIIFCRKPFRLIFRVFHGIMDGKGVLMWMENIFRALRGEALPEALSTETDQGFLRHLPARRFPNKLKFDLQIFREKRKLESFQLYRKRLSLEGNHPALLAKTAKVLTEYFHAPQNKFLVPADLRRHRKKLACTSNLALPVFLETEKGQPWKDINGQLLFHLKNGDELNANNARPGISGSLPGWLYRGGIRSLKAIQELSGRFLVGGILSHMGKIDLALFSSETFSAGTFYSLPLSQPFAPFCMVFAESKGRTEILLSAYHDVLPESEAEQLMKELKEFLELHQSEAVNF